MHKQTICLFLLICSVLVSGRLFAGDFINYPAPEGAEAANDFELEINGQKVFVYNTRSAAYAYFSFEGSVNIIVRPGAQIYSYDIRPSVQKIAGTIYRNEIRFSIDKPQQLSVEINKNLKRPLFIFANGLEKNIPAKNSKDLIYFAAGKIYNAGKTELKSNQQVYIEGGAIVRGAFNIENAENVKITGRGILDNSRYIKAETRPIAITHCKNVLIEGITIAESKHWSCGSYGSTDIKYRNLKIVSDNDWDDGIDIVGSQNILVESCFIRTKDDCIAIKSGVDYFSKKPDHVNVKNVMVKDCVFWNGVWGNALEIGFETSTDTIQAITFQNCDIIHTEGPEGTFTIHNGDRALVTDVLYENIRVEDARGYLVDFKILNSQYTTDKEKGRIDNIRFRDITVEGDIFPTSLILGYDEKHKITNVMFENFYIHGKKVGSTYGGMMGVALADSIIFK